MDVVKVILERSSVVEIEMLDALGQKPDSMAVRAGNFHRSSEGKGSHTCVMLKYSTYHEGPCRCLHLRVSIWKNGQASHVLSSLPINAHKLASSRQSSDILH
jgi:hypothetical protein